MALVLSFAGLASAWVPAGAARRPLAVGALPSTGQTRQDALGMLGSSGNRADSSDSRLMSGHDASQPDFPAHGLPARGVPSRGGTTSAGQTDEELLVASRGGDREAFRTILERHREDLLRFLFRFLGSKSAADDVFQETFLQVHLAADTFDASRRFRPWLYAIAANKARDSHRRQKRRAMTSLSAPVGQGDASLIDMLELDAPSPDVPVMAGETQAAVKRVVDEMPVHYREILLLAYFQRMSYQQIADCLSIPLGTVKSRLHAAVAHFSVTWKSSRDGAGDGSGSDH